MGIQICKYIKGWSWYDRAPKFTYSMECQSLGTIAQNGKTWYSEVKMTDQMYNIWLENSWKELFNGVLFAANGVIQQKLESSQVDSFSLLLKLDCTVSKHSGMEEWFFQFLFVTPPSGRMFFSSSICHSTIWNHLQYNVVHYSCTLQLQKRRYIFPCCSKVTHGKHHIPTVIPHMISITFQQLYRLISCKKCWMEVKWSV